MKQDDIHNKVINALEQRAKHHQQRHQVMNAVFARIEEQRHHKYSRWGITGFALAAAITGIVVIPDTFFPQKDTNQNSTLVSNKLTPQLADDLDMLLVLGEDKTHGS